MENVSRNNRQANIAVVGLGYWGRNLVRNFYDLGALAVLCDSEKSVEANYTREYAGVKFCADFQAVLLDPRVKAVALATPAATHYELAKAALEASKDVFVEKPLAIDLADGEDLVRLAKAKSRILMVGHVLLYHPAILKLQQLIHDGELGKIQYLYSNRLDIGKIRSKENVLWSFGTHDVSVILSLLNEMPARVVCQGYAYLNRDVFDVALSHLDFPSGVQAHIFTSWLHPVKERKLVIVGSEKMAIFDDAADHKLTLYPHKVEWRDRIPLAVKAEGEAMVLAADEPLRAECRHFLDCIASRTSPISNGDEGLRVLRVLDACQRALAKGTIDFEEVVERLYFVHPSARADEGAEIGAGTKIWHYSHIMQGARIGRGCVIGQNVNVAAGAIVGNNVKIQNNVSIYTGVVVEDDVFLGPSCVLTNVTNPRSQVNRHLLYEATYLKRGCTIGANATIVCGTSIGRYAFVGAGAVVTKNVPDYALVVGNPSRQIGWMSRHGHRLKKPDSEGIMRCPETGYRYKEVSPDILRCLDLDEEAALSAALRVGVNSYRQLKDRA